MLVVREMHGYLDEVTETFHNVVDTLRPDDRLHFLTCEEAINQANERVLFLAKNGFPFLFLMNYTEPTPPWYGSFEVILPAGEYRALPQLLVPGSVGEVLVEELWGLSATSPLSSTGTSDLAQELEQ